MGLFRKSTRQATADGTTIFFASDLHGSEICFRKFVNAAAFYKADVLLLGGDISGKIVVPLVEAGKDTYRARLHGSDEVILADSLDEFVYELGLGGNFFGHVGEEDVVLSEED